MCTLPYYRNLNKLSQHQVADVLGVNRTTYSAWESGKNCPDTWNVKLLADYYKIKMEDMLDVSKVK